MIAVDSCVWIDFSKGQNTTASRLLEQALLQENVVLPAPVLFEILSAPELSQEVEQLFCRMPRIDVFPESWRLAARMRQRLLEQGLKARSFDCLVAQCCIDHKVPLLTSDTDFRHFKPFGLEILS